MSRSSNKIIPQIPDSNDDMVLLSKTLIRNPFNDLDYLRNYNNDCDKKGIDFKVEVKNMFNGRICDSKRPKYKFPSNKTKENYIKNILKREKSNSFGKNINKELFNERKTDINYFRKDINMMHKNTSRVLLNKDNSSIMRNKSMRNMNNTKEILKKRHSSLIFFNEISKKQGRNNNNNTNDLGHNCISSHDKENTNRMNNINSKKDPWKRSKLIYSFAPKKKASTNNLMNYILSSPRKDNKNKKNTKDSITLDHIPFHHQRNTRTGNYFNSESASNLKTNSKKNQSTFDRTNSSTNKGFTCKENNSKRPSLTSNVSMDKLRSSLSEASNKLVSELCQMNREYYDSYKESKVKTLDMIDKEQDLESVLDIKVDFRNKRQIGYELNKRFNSKEEREYKKAVVEFSKRIINFNPESTLKLADLIRDEYFKKTRNGKYDKNSLSEESHNTEMRRTKSKMNRNQFYLSKIWSEYEKVKEKFFPSKNKMGLIL